MENNQETNALGETFSEAVQKLEEKNSIIKLDELNINALAEIQGKKEALQLVVKDNPFIKISDTATYELAKKSRTALRSSRTETEKEEKALLAAVKSNIVDGIKNIYGEFKQIVSPGEEEQQTEVKRWEDIKDEEKREKQRLDDERKERHKKNIDLFYSSNNEVIANLNFEQSKLFKINEKVDQEIITEEFFEEYQDVYESKLDILKEKLADKVKTLKDLEDLRIREEKIKQDQAEQKRVSSISKNIEDYYRHWMHRISNEMEFENISAFKKEFSDFKALDCSEFQPQFAEKRADLVKALEAKTNFLTEQQKLNAQKNKSEALDKLYNDATATIDALNFDKILVFNETFKRLLNSENNELEPELTEKKEQLRKMADSKISFIKSEELLRLEREKFAKEQEDVRIEKLIENRKNHLYQIGFDKDLVYDYGVKILVPEEDLKVSDVDWNTLLENIASTINAPELEIEVADAENISETVEDTQEVTFELTPEQEKAKEIILGFYYYSMNIDGELREERIYQYVETL